MAYATVGTIGGYGVNAWRGQLILGGYKYAIYEQGGVQGYGVQFGALKTPSQLISTIYRAANAADAATTYVAYRNLNSQSITVIDQFGVSWLQVIVLGAVPQYANDPLGWIVSCDWTLLPQST